MMPAWVRDFIGIPWTERGRDRTGCDCFGLLRLCLSEQFGVRLPSYTEDYVTTADREEIARLIRVELGAGPWCEIPLTDAQPGDGVLFRIEGDPMHIGVVIAPPQFLHVRRGANACIEDWTRPQWARRLLGAYRHEALSG